MRGSAWWALGLLCVAGCGGEVIAPDDPDDLAHPSIPADAELPEASDAPLLPPIVDDPAPDAAPRDAPTGVVDAPVAVDAGAEAMTVDVPATRDVAAAADAGGSPPRCTGSASGQSSIWTCTSSLAARQRCVSGRVETQACAHGCLRRPSGTPDVCAEAPPATPTLPNCARRPLLRAGLHPDASDRLRCAGVPASRITQTLGYAAASAGTHGPDGRVNGAQYSAATDLSTRGLSNSEIRTLLSRLADQGFAAWYRQPGYDGWPAREAPHIHAVFAAVPMKASLRAQVRSWLAGRNGLVSDTVYRFYAWSAAQRALVRTVFARAN